MFSFSSIFPVGTVNLDYDIFVHVPKLDAKDLKTVQRLYRADDFDFRLKPGSAAVDRGMVLHNVTDGSTGSAPDLGALVIGQMPPTTRLATLALDRPCEAPANPDVHSTPGCK